jgi:hypothetical protein
VYNFNQDLGENLIKSKKWMDLLLSMVKDSRMKEIEENKIFF